MLEYKVAQFLQKLPKNCQSIFYLKVIFLKIAPNGNKYLGYFCKKTYCQQLSKIAQSGHTGPSSRLPNNFSTYLIITALSMEFTVSMGITIKSWYIKSNFTHSALQWVVMSSR